MGGIGHAQSHYKVTRLDNTINTAGNESAAVVIDDSILLYNSMRDQDDNRLYLIDFTPVLNKVYQTPLAADGSLGEGLINRWGVNISGMNSGNVAYDRKNGILYFTRNGSNDDVAHIYYSKRRHNQWGKAQPLGGDVNLKGFHSTHPAVGYLPDGKSILYFSSDRPGGMGGMDIWYTILIREGQPGNCTNLGSPVNSDSNEVTPFYCIEEGTLYFSSDREGGLGQFDIYRSKGCRNSWETPLSLGPEINSAYNDLYFTFQPCRCRCVQDSTDQTHELEACGFLASNRPGSLYTTDSNCCNDLYRWQRLRATDTPPAAPAIPANHNVLDLLPLSLYFHNDEPNPHTLDTTTTLDYTATWLHYIQRLDEYKGAQPNPAEVRKRDSVQKAVDLFFENEVHKGHSDMLQLLQLLYKDLQEGRRCVLTIDGFASPLFEDPYNINISKRRISCFRNTLIRWNDNALLPFLNNGSLRLETAAHGAADTHTVAPTDPRRNPKSVRSVYSLEAARDRRIDIIGYRITQ